MDLVVGSPESQPKIRILEQVVSFGDVLCRGRMESFPRDRKGAKKPRKGAFQERLRELYPVGELHKPMESYLSYHV